jgi:metal-responsive CopG/Arc/MetJ family transcriptional regulator
MRDENKKPKPRIVVEIDKKTFDKFTNLAKKNHDSDRSRIVRKLVKNWIQTEEAHR